MLLNRCHTLTSFNDALNICVVETWNICMIWSEEELANMVAAGKEIAVERVMGHLDEPINRDIFSKQNFSYLWGILGVSGLQGTTEKARELIWEWLNSNGVIEAYTSGQLELFNKELLAQHKDNRLTSWINKNNFESERFFRTEIIEKLAATNTRLAKEVAYSGCHCSAIIETLAEGNLDDRVRFYLKYLLDFKDDSSSVIKAMEFHEVLRSLVQIIKYRKNKLKEEEKEFFYHYFKEALAEGEDRHLLGIDDDFFVLLMFDGDAGEVSEIRTTVGLARNQEIREQVSEFEDQDGFYDQTTAVYIRYEHEQIADLVAKCLRLAETGEKPRGVCFVLELIKLGQVKSAVLVLQQLANKGQALGCIGYLSWLLTSAKGAEQLIAEILVCNLHEMQKQKVKADFEEKRKAYIAQFYLTAVEVFSDAKRPEEAILLMKSLSEGGFFEGMRDNPDYLIYVMNELLIDCPDFKEQLIDIARSLDLRVLEEKGSLVIAQTKEKTLSFARHHVENLIKDTKKFDFHHIFEKMRLDDNEVDDKGQQVNDIFNAEEQGVSTQSEDLSTGENKVSDVELNEPESVKENEIVLKDVEGTVSEEKKDDLPLPDLPQQAVPENEEPQIGKKDEILRWEVKETAEDEDDNKININNILDIKPDEVDKHFSKIKRITDAAIRSAEDKAHAIRNKVRNAQNEFLSASRFKNLVKKIGSFRKK